MWNKECKDTKMRDIVFNETGIEERDVHFNCQRLKVFESEEWKQLRAEYDAIKAKFMEENKEKFVQIQKDAIEIKKAEQEKKLEEEKKAKAKNLELLE
jgi:hypothetical protein